MRFSAVVSTVLGLLSSITTAESNLTAEERTQQKILQSDFTPPSVFENTNVVRTINLEKGYVRETTNVLVTNTDKLAQSEYYIPFAYDVIGKIGGFDVRDKKHAEGGPLEAYIASLSGISTPGESLPR